MVKGWILLAGVAAAALLSLLQIEPTVGLVLSCLCGIGASRTLWKGKIYSSSEAYVVRLCPIAACMTTYLLLKSQPQSARGVLIAYLLPLLLHLFLSLRIGESGLALKDHSGGPQGAGD